MSALTETLKEIEALYIEAWSASTHYWMAQRAVDSPFVVENRISAANPTHWAKLEEMPSKQREKILNRIRQRDPQYREQWRKVTLARTRFLSSLRTFLANSYRALETYPDQSLLWFWLGMAFYQWDDSLEHKKEFDRDAPLELRLAWWISQVEYRRADLHLLIAKAAFDRAVQVDDNCHPYAAFMSLATLSQNWDRIMSYLSEVARRDSGEKLPTEQVLTLGEIKARLRRVRYNPGLIDLNIRGGGRKNRLSSQDEHDLVYESTQYEVFEPEELTLPYLYRKAEELSAVLQRTLDPRRLFSSDVTVNDVSFRCFITENDWWEALYHYTLFSSFFIGEITRTTEEFVTAGHRLREENDCFSGECHLMAAQLWEKGLRRENGYHIRLMNETELVLTQVDQDQSEQLVSRCFIGAEKYPGTDLGASLRLEPAILVEDHYLESLDKLIAATTPLQDNATVQDVGFKVQRLLIRYHLARNELQVALSVFRLLIDQIFNCLNYESFCPVLESLLLQVAETCDANNGAMLLDVYSFAVNRGMVRKPEEWRNLGKSGYERHIINKLYLHLLASQMHYLDFEPRLIDRRFEWWGVVKVESSSDEDPIVASFSDEWLAISDETHAEIKTLNLLGLQLDRIKRLVEDSQQQTTPSVIDKLKQDFSAIVEKALAEMSQSASQADANVNVLLDDALSIERIRADCAANWPEHWMQFSPLLQAKIIEAERTHRNAKLQKANDYSSCVMAWGTVAEMALREAFFLPFLRYLDATYYTQPVRFMRGQPEKPMTDEWSRYGKLWQGSTRCDWAVIEGMLWAAGKHPDYHPAFRFLSDSGYDAHLWCMRMVAQSRIIRELRNPAAHGEGQHSEQDADRVRALLVSGGFLSEIGIAKQALQQTRLGPA
jgi:DNA-binding transcriptional MerR regulator